MINPRDDETRENTRTALRTPSTVFDCVPTANSTNFSKRDSRSSLSLSRNCNSSGESSAAAGRLRAFHIMCRVSSCSARSTICENESVSHREQGDDGKRTIASSLYPSRPRSASALTMSQALLCLPPSSSSIHDVMSRIPNSAAIRAQIAPSDKTSSSVKEATSISSRPATASLREVESSSSSSRIFVLFVFDRPVASIIRRMVATALASTTGDECDKNCFVTSSHRLE